MKVIEAQRGLRIGELFVPLAWHRGRMEGICPFCGSDRFVANLRLARFHCFGCGENNEVEGETVMRRVGE
jgi:transposase-like protein